MTSSSDLAASPAADSNGAVLQARIPDGPRKRVVLSLKSTTPQVTVETMTTKPPITNQNRKIAGLSDAPTKTTTETTTESKPKRPSGRSAYDRLVDYLARRDHSERELREKLKKAQHTDQEIESAIGEARERKWLPDESVLATREADRLARQGKSPQQIRVWLSRKGLPTSGLQALLTENEEQSAYKTALKAWAQQRRLAERQLAKLADADGSDDSFSQPDLERLLRDRLQRLLISRGFSGSTARAVFTRLLKENPLS